MIMVGAGDVARSTGAGAATVERLVHGRKNLRMLAHAEIVVRAPDRYLFRAGGGMMRRFGKGSHLAFEVGEHAITSFATETIQLAPKIVLVVHDALPSVVRLISIMV